MPDLRPPLGPIFAAFGEPRAASIIPPDADAITTDVILGWDNAEFPATADLAVLERRRVATLRRAQVPNLPRGTRIELAEPIEVDGELLNVLTVESILSDDDELVRVVVR